MTDLPDWTDTVQQSGAAYRGELQIAKPDAASVQQSFTFNLNALDRSVLVFTPLLPPGLTAFIDVQAAVAPFTRTRQAVITGDQRMVAGYASPDIATQWRVVVDLVGAPTGTRSFDIFTDQLLPIVEVAGLGDGQEAQDEVGNLTTPVVQTLPYVYDAARAFWGRTLGVRGRTIVQGQPDPTWATQQFNTGANLASTTTVLVAAPGAGLAIRLVAAYKSRYVASPATSVESVLRTDPAGAEVRRFAWDVSQKELQSFVLPSPGIRLPTNVGLQATSTSSGAADVILSTLVYYTDAV